MYRYRFLPWNNIHGSRLFETFQSEFSALYEELRDKELRVVTFYIYKSI